MASSERNYDIYTPYSNDLVLVDRGVLTNLVGLLKLVPLEAVKTEMILRIKYAGSREDYRNIVHEEADFQLLVKRIEEEQREKWEVHAAESQNEI